MEVKNLNSIRNVRRAIDAEVERQTKMLDNGETIIQQTRGYDADTNTTAGQRDKEEANDYRYLPCPDLPPFEISDAWLNEVQYMLPELPETLFEKYTNALGLPVQDAEVLTEEGLTIASFAAGGGETDGTRRFLRIGLPDVALEPAGEDLWLSFTLPAGSYATVVLGELLKPGN